MIKIGTSSVPDDIRALNRAYKSGKLRILVGAGASMRAGFPGWDSLYRDLLSAFLTHDIMQTDSGGLQLLLTLLPDLTDTVYKKLGREAMDLVWDNLHVDIFFRLIAEVLYSNRRIEDLPITSLHRQIVAMEKARLFTTNYDPLLELAMSRLYDGVSRSSEQATDNWNKYLSVVDWSNPQQTSLTRKVNHIHGFVYPDGRREGHCVLTEGHYFELAKNAALPANRALLDLLRDEGELLIIGMSLFRPESSAISV